MTLHVTLSGARLKTDRAPSDRWVTTYGIGSMLQAAPDTLILIANRRVNQRAVVDFEDGSDAFVFGSFKQLETAPAMPLIRTEEATDPDTGRKLWMVAHLVSGSFVPLGALLPDGKPHPAAGTGFAVAILVGVPQGQGNTLPRDSRHQFELIQLRYDGKALSITGRTRFNGDELLPGWVYRCHPLGAGVPDGVDLLTGIVVGPIVREGLQPPYAIPSTHPHASRVLGRNYGSALCRWRFDGKAWKPAAITPVTGADLSVEPSLVRDRDGSLLMSVRGKGMKDPPGSVHDGLENTYEHFRVYRSRDNGATWSPDLHLPRMRNATPVVLNRTLGGRPYLAANPYQFRKSETGRVVPSTNIRDLLCAWPLTADRKGVEAPVMILDLVRRFGPARPVPEEALYHGNVWNADHPVGNVCRMADGKWHGLLCFRVGDSALNQGGYAAPEPAGLWIEEVTDDGEAPDPIWQFSQAADRKIGLQTEGTVKGQSE